ncbi:30S ribosomal protein S5 [Deltaproteobacteria bacterium]|nr:30S ribosomal protein S5 [Deltaproteobacteria bacterium]
MSFPDRKKSGPPRKVADDAQLIEKNIYVNRVAKVVKGGRRFSFAALVVVGNGDGRIGIGQGKANEVPEAVRKATERARRSMFDVPVVDGTVPHVIQGRFGAGKVLLRPANPGTGVIAGPVVRALLDAAGYHNVLTKSLGSSNPYNVAKATVEALRTVESPAMVAARRGKSIEHVIGNYDLAHRVWSKDAGSKENA